MKSLNGTKIFPYLLTFMFAGCAGSGGENLFGTVDSGLGTVGQTAETGRSVIQAGRAAAAGTYVGEDGLTNVLINELGVSPRQALGGAGAIFEIAKTRMAPQAFASLSQSITGMDDMLAAAPLVNPPLSGTATLLKGTSGTVNRMASLADSFRQLNLSPDMVSQFISVVVNYVSQKSGQYSANLLQAALTVP